MTTPKMTPAEYMDLLVQRREEFYAVHPAKPGFPALLEWFVRDDDEDLVDMDAVAAATQAPKAPPARPRRYRPAAEIRADLERVAARLDTLLGSGHRHPTTDRAAYTGIGIRQTPRQMARHGARIDRTAAEVVRLTQRRSDLTARLARAQAREAR